MKTIRFVLLAGTVLLLLASRGRAQGDIISAANFKDLLATEKNLVVIDAGKADNFRKNHIENAISIPAGDLNQEDGKVHGLLKDPEELAKLLGAKGIAETNVVVVYDEGSQKYASRVFWVLKYLGAEHVKILHQDKEVFKKAKIPLTSRPTKARPVVTFTPQVNHEVFADESFLKSSGKSVIIDVRSDEEFNGSVGYSKGHIPGAVHLNYDNLLDDGGAFLPKKKMESIVEKYGFTPETHFVVYCRSGVRASVAYAAFVNVLGYQNVKVYDGSYLEWVAKGNKVDR